MLYSTPVGRHGKYPVNHARQANRPLGLRWLLRIRGWGMLVLGIIAFVGTVQSLPLQAQTEAAAKPIAGLRRLDHFALHVTDLDRSAAFYQRVFGFQIINKWSTTWMVGNDTIRVGLFLRPAAKPVSDPDNAVLIEHVAFLTDEAGFAGAVKQLDSLGVAHDLPEDTGIAKSVFLKDPDGHSLEITYYYQHVPKLVP
jgi:glyoxylase I family protein